MTVLSGFEMSGERMAVAYETRDQEEELSCFSDTSHVDMIANQEGILAVYRGTGPGTSGPGLRELARAVDADLAAEIDARLTASLEALRAIPPPFDRAIQGPDDSPGRRAVLAAVEALEAQAESLAALGLLLGSDIPLVPGS
jgi:putative iron-regulated protein